MKKYTMKDRELKVLSVLGMVVIWSVVSVAVNREVLVPSPVATIRSLLEIASESGFYIAVLCTAGRSVAGVVAAALFAFVCGILSKYIKACRIALGLAVDFLGAVPVIAVIILAIIWLQNSLVPVFVGLLVSFPVLYDNVMASIDGVDKEIVEMAEVYKVRKLVVFREIYAPSIARGIFDISSTTVSITLKMVVAGEVLSQPEFSVGANLQVERAYLNTPGVFAWVVVILALSKSLNIIVDMVKRRFDSREWM